MLSFSRLAILALPLFGSVLADDNASPAKEIGQSIYSNAHEAFQDLLNALPEESLRAAFSGTLKDFKSGIFETHHRGVEQVHNKNPALATKLIVAAVQDLKKRQNPSNGTTTAAPPSSQAPPPQSSPARTSDAPPNSPANSPTTNNPPASTTNTDRAVIVNVQQTTTNSQGQTVVQTTSVLSVATASVPVTVTRTNAQGQTVTSTENRPAVVRTTTDSVGRAATVTSAAEFAPTAGEVRTQTDAGGRTFVTTYTPGGGKISSVKLLTTTDAEGRPSTITSYTFVDPAEATGNANAGVASGSGRPGLQSGADTVQQTGFGLLVAVVGAVGALFV
ncbi:hypothetical protein IQ06DRAFT_298849 [Phaeosphaeriaceae sp. SRC1lsM3a]|nr:hypothetical protein IQ06DRAFT_298849 [Stagonospora sp. SRC1lsM3a]